MLVYLWIPAIAVLVDLLVSYVLLNRLSIYAKAAPPLEGPDGHLEGRRYVILLQNDEGRDVKAFKRPILIRLKSLNSAPLVCGELEEPPSPCASEEEHEQEDRKGQLFDLGMQVGPGDHVTANRKDEDGQDCIEVKINRVRPWKTYVLTCKVRTQIEGLRVELRVPKRSPLQSLLQRINKHAFEWAETYHRIGFEVRHREPTGESTKGELRGLLYVGVPLIVLCAAFYFAFCKIAWQVYAPLYHISGEWTLGSILRIPYIWVDIVFFTLAFALTWTLARSPSVPPAPGYQKTRYLLREKESEKDPKADLGKA